MSRPKGVAEVPKTAPMRTGMARPTTVMVGSNGRIPAGRNWCARPSASKTSPSTGV